MVKPKSGLLRRRGDGKRGAIYARYSTRFQHSIEDQVRSCREWAEKNGIDVIRVYADAGVSGKTSRRSGLLELKTALTNGDIDVVIVFSTNRLYRNLHQSLKFVIEEVKGRGHRCVFVHSNIDTNDKERWKMSLHIAGFMDEWLVTNAAKHVNEAHIGLLLLGLVYGTISFGYLGEPIEGQIGRNGKVRKRLAIDPDQSIWVKRIFQWFVIEGMNLTAIARRLNREGTPLPPRHGAKGWTPGAVKGVLKNRRYLGEWSYGTTEIDWSGGKTYPDQIPRESPLRTVQFDQLRIIDDVEFARAQERLTELPGGAGRPPKDGDRRSRPKVLNQLLYCAEHQNQVLHAGGGNGRHMICPICKLQDDPYLYSVLNRRLALELLCERLASMLMCDEDFVETVIACCRSTVESLGESDPDEIKDLERQIQRLSKKIDFIYDAPGETDKDLSESKTRLRGYRKEREHLERRLAERRKASERSTRVPEPEEVRSECRKLGAILADAGISDDAEIAAAAHNLIRTMTRGKILVSQVGARERKQGHVRLTFDVDRFSALSENTRSPDCSESVVIEIDVVPKDCTDDDLRQLEPLFDGELLLKEIAAQTGHYYSYVRKLWQLYCERRGIPADGRKRRAQLVRKQLTSTVHESIAQQATKMAEDGASVLSIAQACNVSWSTAKRALRKHRTFSESYREAQSRKRQVVHDRIIKLFERGLPLNEIALKAQRTTTTVRNVLKAWFSSKGETMPDMRRRRHKIAAQRRLERPVPDAAGETENVSEERRCG